MFFDSKVKKALRLSIQSVFFITPPNYSLLELILFGQSYTYLKYTYGIEQFLFVS